MDVFSVNYLLTDEAIEEIKRRLNSKDSILTEDGNFIASTDTNIPRRVMSAFTGEVKE